MCWMKSVLFQFFALCSLGLLCTTAIADVKGDVNNDNKIGLVESIYALRVVGQSTGAIFEADDINGRVFYEVNENLALKQTCIIELQYGLSEVNLKEWLYINDDTWIVGCEDDYIEGDEATIPYIITNGIIELAIPGEPPWQIHLVEKFTENYLTSSIDGPSTWYFTKDKVNSIVDPKIKFNQEILSANPWYIVETYPATPENPECNGKFIFDGNITLTVQWDDGGVPGEASGIYSHHNGSLVTNHDQKVETETIWTYSTDLITTMKSVLHGDGSTDGTGTIKTWFKNKSDAETFLSSKGANICFPTEVSISTVTSTTGRVWMDRNLGASQVAETMNDANACGDFYQWGRLADGHEDKTSLTTPDVSSTEVPGHGDFILGNQASDYWDWINPRREDLWQGVDGINNPCPDGFRLPTKTELQNEQASWTPSDAVGAFNSPLKLPICGYRSAGSGSISFPDQIGNVWSSTPYTADDKSYNLEYSVGISYSATYDRGYGLNIRCIKEE